ncbi:heavy metal translocating P-type ATPase [Subtercola sp. Z020]|uniref:heavy metal translocating P-type ATPase n=1 Tax=Subtercola sp. Z020 TaxID=2080582 RepID=UPI000CE7DE56|nr:heavy metal translocating P-type ATPase [Subtercola sp. Z020]PPF77854.1 heavy metal translocating P-type ATPase [Subtercola sp. Z020]
MTTPQEHDHEHHAGHPGRAAEHPGGDEALGHEEMALDEVAHGHSAHTGHDVSQGGHDHAGHDDHAHGDHAGHGGHGHGHGHGDHAAQFRTKFWATLVLAIPTVIFSSMFASLLGYRVPDFPGAALISPALGTIIFFYGGAPFLTGGLAELRSRRPGMMLLIAMAITVAFVASWITTLRLGSFDLDFWWELALLVVIMLLGHWVEMRALGAASGALDALAALLPDTAERVAPGDSSSPPEEVPVSELRTGDTVLVRSGARVPADGVVASGVAAVDESMITGESAAVRREPGDRVVAGTVATDNALRVRVTAIGDDTALAGIQRLVADAQNSSSRAQALADRAAALLFYYAAGAGIVTFVVWSLVGNLDDAVTRTVTVLVIACPHALGLAIPLVIAISTERAARAGVLVKNRLALERMRTVDVVLFDKTGTLTEGRPAVTDVAVVAPAHADAAHADAAHAGAADVDAAHAAEGDAHLSQAGLLALAAALEADGEHPLARAIVRAAAAPATPAPAPASPSSIDSSKTVAMGADDRQISPSRLGGAGADGAARFVAQEVRSVTGQGVQGVVDGATVSVGGPAMLRAAGARVPASIAAATSAWSERGATVLHVLRNGDVLGALALEDGIRPESREAVDALHARGVTVAMITGDSHTVANAVAARLGIDEVFSEVLPEDKDSKVAELQARGRRVAMVGDGVNDAPALARADVGIAIGGGTDVAIESAGVVLAGSDPRAVLSVIELSRASYRKMIQNLVWGAGYNLLSVPLAAGVLAPVGFVLSPAVGAILMSVSTIIVAANAQLLRRVDLDPARLAKARG